MKHGIGNAPGKIILMGEHSVVYGKPAIALPFYSVGVKCEIIPQKGPLEIESYCYEGLVDLAPTTLKGIQKLIQVTLETLKEKAQDFKILIKSSIPAQRGLGSSAAVSVAIVRALFDAFEKELDFNTLNELVFVAESIHHRNPSGLDANTILRERFLMFERDKGITHIDTKLQGYIIVADTGQKGHTKASVDNVQNRLKQDPHATISVIDKLGDITFRAKRSILNDDLKSLGEYMNQSHLLLKELGVSNQNLDLLVDVALYEGALGAKLTGGGNGGCIIALSDSMVEAKKIADALLAQHAAHTWIYHLSEV